MRKIITFRMKILYICTKNWKSLNLTTDAKQFTSS